MEPFRRLNATAVAFWRDNIDTDQIINGREVLRPANANFADGLFAEWRYIGRREENPDFILNKPGYRDAKVFVCGRNFGCGSSREGAAWTIRDFGVRAIIAPGYGSIFRNNAVRNGVVPVVLPYEQAEAVAKEVLDDMAQVASGAKSNPATIDVDLEKQEVTSPSGRKYGFAIERLDKEFLIKGVDSIDLVRGYDGDIAAFQAADHLRRPWVYAVAAKAKGVT